MIDWHECVKKRIVKDVQEDIYLINSLIKSSRNKLKSSDNLAISEVTASSKLSLAYDSLRELLESIALKKGFKIYNHECYTAFLKEILNQSNNGDEFDEIRKVRNAINYYGKDISIGEAENIIQKIKKLIRHFLKLI
ncbi:MAG TPA: hypothetical protein VJH68_05190 [Candidatus Nanoarchaeia archaeon]|nr:hypothetical protein [Candidatus Nanoarchaeia archaeon]